MCVVNQLNIKGLPEQLTLTDLNENYCNIFCVDQYARAYTEFYRLIINNDYNLKYIGNAIEQHNGEGMYCEC